MPGTEDRIEQFIKRESRKKILLEAASIILTKIAKHGWEHEHARKEAEQNRIHR